MKNTVYDSFQDLSCRKNSKRGTVMVQIIVCDALTGELSCVESDNKDHTVKGCKDGDHMRVNCQPVPL
uniref:Uncharacterized protein n=1 Tax=Solanum lycopersicum TaxID=4081 RepID=A0A3Q7FKF8_SOLLC